MSGKNLELSLVMRLRDFASSGASRAMRDIQAGIASTEKATANLTRTVGNLGKARSAADVLGIRTEQNIQREIQRTEAAYNRLARSGTMSFREQLRTAEATRRKLVEMNNEMGKYTLAQKAAGGLRAGAAIAGGLVAGGYVLSKPISQTMDYGVRLAQMSNTAFNERDTVGRIAGKRELNAAIVNAVRHGGGTRDSAAETLDTLIASGAMSAKDSMAMLPALMRASTASGADAGELAQIGIRGMQTMGIKPGEMGRILDMAITAGQAGGFELKDMAKWLPQQMAAAKLSGMSGTAGMAKLLAANQASAITAGTKDEAGNNLVNLLAKINSRDTAVDAQRLGINLSGTLAAARGKGMDSLDAFIGIVDHVVGKNKDYQALQGKLKNATGSERKTMLESQADILQGSAIGQLVQDRQALMALVGIMGNRGHMASVQKKTLAEMNAGPGEGAAERNYAVIAEEAGFKVDQAANEKIFATQDAFEHLTPLIGRVADGMAEHARQYPLLTASTVAATTGLTALAAAAIGMAGLSTMMGGKGAGGAAGGLVRGVGGAAAKAGGYGLAAFTGWEAGYAIGENVIAPGIDYAVNKLTDSGNLGSLIYDLLHREQEPIKVVVDVQNGNIAASVNESNTRSARRN